MSKSQPAGQERTGHDATVSTTNRDPDVGHRPPYFRLGRTNGRDYLADLRTRTVHVINPDGTRHHRYHLNGKSLDEFMEAVASAHGWERRSYGGGIKGLIERGMDA
ncbi:hypothetical protein [Halosegnis longus]|uniref:hypothetical protein n=1 Tax=Halosegnis longus TaxID=2216012 RepID=UPI00129E2EE6|nr:hypothetical protein [Halosegnis longus]